MSSLQDQLLKAGLVGEKQAKQAKKDKRKATKVKHKSKQPQVDETKLQVQKAQQEKAERDRQLNAERKAEADRKAIAAQIKQLITLNRQDKMASDFGKPEEVTYNFTDGKKIKKLYISNKVQELLTRGRLVIAKLDDNYELVPYPVAEKIAHATSRY